MTDRTFACAYRFGLAFKHVWLPLIIGSVLGLVGLYMNRPVFSLISAAFTATAVWHWPYLDTRRIILRLTHQGVDIEGIGHIPWQFIAHVDLIDPKKRKVSDPNDNTLRIHLSDTIETVSVDLPQMQRPRWMRTFKTIEKSKQILIEPDFLSDDQTKLANAFAWFLKNKK